MNISIRRMRGHWNAVVEKNGETKMKNLMIPCKVGSDIGKRKAMEAAELWAQSIVWEEQVKSPVLAEWCQTVIDGQYRRNEIEGATYKGYGCICRNIRIWFKDKALADITPDDLRGFIEWLMVERELSAATAKKNYNFLAMCLRKALAERIIEWSPSVAVKAPKTKLTDPNPLTERSLRVLIARLSELPQTQEVTATWIALHTGMRRGEIAGLRWHSVDFSRGVISVSEAIGFKPGGTYIKGTKTGKSRLVPITPQLEVILQRRRNAMFEECMAIGVPMSPSLYVCGRIDGAPLQMAHLSKWWAAHAKEWQLDGTQGKRPVFHDLRHTYATLAVRALDLKTAQDILGHTTPIMTMRYADTEAEQVRQAVAVMGQAFPNITSLTPSVLSLEAM